jgi:signal transduction histidine kinase
MVGRLAAAFDSQRRFVANASHELRTPLTMTRTLIEVALGRSDTPAQTRELGTALLEVNERQQIMIDGLLALAESERPLAGTVAVNLREVLRRAVQVLGPEADQQGVTVAVDGTDTFVDGDPVLLERLAMNLVQNAIRHNQPGGRVWASCSTTPMGPEFRVANTGPAMTAERLDELFEPFRRGPAGPGQPRGNGLGLSIVRAIVAAHGGTVAAFPREDGGLTVVVNLPRPALGLGPPR